MQNGIYLYKKKTTLWCLELSKAILEQVKAVVLDYNCRLQFFKKQKLRTLH